MAIKDVTHTKQYKDLQAELFAARNNIAELSKKLEEKTKSADMWYKSKFDLDQEINQVHSLLDALPGAPAHEMENKSGYGSTTLSLMTRIAGYLAQRS